MAQCRMGELGSVLRAVFDNIQQPKLSVITESGSDVVYESILIRPALFSRATAAYSFQISTDSHKNLRPLVA